jgi:hypothetical protein
MAPLIPGILPRRSLRILTLLGIVSLFAGFLRNGTVYTSTLSSGEGKTSSHGQGSPLEPVTVTRVKTAWAEVTSTITAAEPEPTTRPQQVAITDGPLKDHNYRSDGLLEVSPDGSHPIFELIRNAEEEWDAKLASSSKTLAQAVAEYHRRYKRPPPLGFDDWFVMTAFLTAVNT